MRRGRQAGFEGIRGSLSLMSLSALLSHLESERAGGRLTLQTGAWPGLGSLATEAITLP